ncbi:MAG: LTA synthase family protein [Deltaproteobacteria bacterium]|nr:LTA synthase family protein [Deltaproteobacteria bacterium]
MNNKKTLPATEGIWQMLRGRFRPLVSIAAVYLVTITILRLVLWAVFGRHFDVSLLQLPIILVLGALNDLVVLPPLLLPLSLWLLVLPTWRHESFLRRISAHIASMAVIFGFIYLAVAQYFFFAQFNARFNLVAVDYLIYPNEVFINIWQTYHVIWFLLAAAIISLAAQMIFASRLVRSKMPGGRFRSRLKFVALHIALAALVIMVFSTDSLSLFNNRVANEITANGISSFFRALHTNELDFDQYYRTIDSKRAFAIMQRELRLTGQKRAGALTDLNRSFPGYANGLGKLNIVAIVEESFGAQFIGAYGDKRGLSPNFDRLARQGLLFANTYASGTRTVRGLGALVTSMPPIPSEGIMKRPGCENIANWGAVLQKKGYQTSFLYGGHGVFDNMNHFFSTNGFAISDIRDIKQITQRTIWGVCDEDIFRHAVKYYNRAAARGKPFFSVIMTTSNHEPYRFPPGIANVPVKGGGRLAGVRYADYAIGKFIKQAEGTSWGKNTLFIIMADHDARVYGRQQVPMRHYRIPLLFLAPGHLRPGVVTTAMGQIDVAPTVMGILGLPFTAPFYGQDVLHWPVGKPRPILVNHDHDVGLLLGTKLVVLGLHKVVTVYNYDAATYDIHRAAGDPQLVDLATAYFQTAFALFKSP